MNANSLPPKLQKLFEKTKLVCFGRFVIDVPMETTVVPGPQTFGASIETIENAASRLHEIAQKKKEEINVAAKTIERAEVRSMERGVTPRSWILTFWDSDSAKEVGLLSVYGYLASGKHTFIYPSKTSDSEGRTEMVLRDRLTYIATHLRARAPDEVPAEPGVCLNLGFIADDSGKYQEIFGIGFRFPSLPDVSLSISSNKDGQTPQPLSVRRKDAERSVIGSILEGKFRQVKVLRDGPRKLYQWDGEEALFRRPREEGGTWQEFRYDYPGIRYDKNNPRLDAAMFTGVDHNTAGGKASSLTDEEAVAFWDAVMATIRLRVPGR